MDVSLRVLRYVVAAADCRNVTEAARRLRVSQPSVSSAIAELEGAVGVQLFIRQHARGINLTPAGDRIVIFAELGCALKRSSGRRLAAALGKAGGGSFERGCD